MRVRYFPRSGWLEGTKAVAVVEGVMEVLGDLDESFGHPKVSLLTYGIGVTTLLRKVVRRYTN